MEKQNTTYVLDTERTYAELESASENKVIKAKLYKKLKYLEPIVVNRLLKRFRDQGLSHADAKTNALVINRDAVIKRFNMDVVFAVVKNKAVMIPVKIVGFVGKKAAVAGKGLIEGMNIVVKGNERVFPKMDVKVLNEMKAE